MRLHRARIVLAAAGLTVSGVVAGFVVSAAPASAGPAVAHAPASTRVVLVNQCTGKGQVRPSTVPLPFCMTSSELIGKLTWTSWRSVAFGSGDLEVNNCTPSSSCGPSKYTRYPILIVLWRAEPWAGRPGDDYFSRLTWILSGKRPSHAPVTHTIALPSSAQ
jgi:hypothetical protein